MATLVLSTVGSYVGGPIGGAIGAFVGQQIDAKIFGGGAYEGPRLKDLSVTTSSYGQPLARHFGTMRVAGTVIWAADLKESKENSGGGKGKPKTTTYSYSASFAVALSGRSIHNVGRIWADGDLLRGSAGDLKVGGEMRTYLGVQDQAIDSLIEAAEGASCPAFRDCAYVVFEDLELGDFGNRIPALTFEVHADELSEVDLSQIVGSESESSTVLPGTLGLSDEGGELGSTLKVINQVYPLICNSETGLPLCTLQDEQVATGITLPRPLSWKGESGERGAETFEKRRTAAARPQPRALRYYDKDRDYQPGVQRAQSGKASGREQMIQFPGTLTANGAREICAAAALRSRWTAETIVWRIAQVDSSLAPGAIVKLPDIPGRWLIREWEWLERGLELRLERLMPRAGVGISGDSGVSRAPADLAVGQTVLQAVELPWDGIGDENSPKIYAAASASTEGWRGAYLYLERAGSLVGIGPTGTSRAVIGALTTTLAPSSSTHIDRGAEFEIELAGAGLVLSDTTVEGLASGENRLLVGNEVLQFLNATQQSETRWIVSGLLRGRGGTEGAALTEQLIGTTAILLDDRLTELDPSQIPSSSATTIAAIGLGDEEPVLTTLTGAGSTRRPLAPVHARHVWKANGDLSLCWTRRARGQWRWDDFVDVPAIEEALLFRVSYGPASSPFMQWEVSATELMLDAATISDLTSAYGPQDLHVCQVGTYDRSPSTLITSLS